MRETGEEERIRETGARETEEEWSMYLKIFTVVEVSNSKDNPVPFLYITDIKC